MFLIFDLDDTLIETSKCLTPYALKRAFEAMIREGMKGTNELFQDLLHRNEMAICARDAIMVFCKQYELSAKILEAGISALSTPLSEEMVIDPVPGAIELLDELQGVCPLALVTRGSEKLQIVKMKKAGIQPEKFSILIVGEGPSKKENYQRVSIEMGMPLNEGVVCGDRVPLDLTPARQLGMCTVHFRNGRGLTHHQPEEDVDVCIHSLGEIPKLLQKGYYEI